MNRLATYGGKENLADTPGGTRTHNLGLRRASLFHLSYWGLQKLYNCKKVVSDLKEPPEKRGGPLNKCAFLWSCAVTRYDPLPGPFSLLQFAV